MNRLAILLVHGFSGGARDLFSLAEGLRDTFGRETVHLPELPDHGGGELPAAFDRDRLVEKLCAQLAGLRQRAETLVVLGHSTGGNLLLAALEQSAIVPELLVLAASPFRIDLAYLERWQRHRQGREGMALTTVAGLVKFINEVAERGSLPACPALLLQGEKDQLVPSGFGDMSIR